MGGTARGGLPGLPPALAKGEKESGWERDGEAHMVTGRMYSRERHTDLRQVKWVDRLLDRRAGTGTGIEAQTAIEGQRLLRRNQR